MTSGSALGDFLEQDQNPAAPAGAQQMAHQAAQGSDSKLASWLTGTANGGRGEQGYTGGAQSWLTGANQEGTNNGWDNQFVADFQDNWATALQAGTARTYFDQPDVTGVVTWDHTSETSNKDYHFGDVYEGGKFKGNLYEKYDKDTANLMMTPWILDPDVQAEAFSASDRMERIDREVQSERENRNANFEKSLTELEFEGNTAKRVEAFKEGGLGDSSIGADEGVVAGTTLGGGALGAGLGSVVPGLGTAVGFGVGSALGFASGYLNRDSLTEQAARAYEITRMSYADHGLPGGIATGVAQWSGFGGKLISPASNLTQGIYDATTGTGGDGTSEFYRVNDQGRNTTPKWVKALDVGATVGDSLLQFSNPVGVALYSGQMSGTIAGEVGELAMTGESFNYRSGRFDNIFKDENGNTDWSAGAAGIGKVAIDAVQLGMARGLTGRANALRADTGLGAAYQSTTSRIAGFLPLRLGGTRGLAAGESRVHAAGFKFTRAADGSIVEGSRRATLSLLAPSEQLASLSARVVGMRTAAQRGGAYTADDFYAAAHALAAGERRIQTALVNGIGEGYEEVMQGILEPYSHGESINGHDLLTAGIYGAAAGVGMSAGTSLRTPSAGDRMYSMAQLGYAFRTGGAQLSRAEWDALPEIEQRSLAELSQSQRATAEAAYRKIIEDQATEQVARVGGVDKVRDAIQSQLSQQLARATDRTDGAFVITQLEAAPAVDALGNLEHGSVPVDAAAASAMQTMVNLNNHMRGLVIGKDTIQAKLDAATAAAAADPADAAAAEEVTARTRQLEMAELTLRWGAQFNQVLDTYHERIDQILTQQGNSAAALPLVEAEVAELNDLLRRAFNRQLDTGLGQVMTEDDKTALARAVSLVFVRDPQDQSGSFQVLVPQVSARLTATGADNVVEISHAILPAIRGDYDGDKIRQQAQLIFDDVEFASARSGAHFIGAGASVNVGAPKYEKYIVEYLAEAFESGGLTMSTFAQETLNQVSAAIRARYDRVIDTATLDEVLAQFQAAVKAGDKDARATLLDGLADLAGGQITAFAREHLSNEWLWIDQLIVSSFQQFQESYAAHRPRTGPAPSTRVVDPVRQSLEVRTRRQESAATLGQTLANLAVGDTLFRQFQKLHYTAINSPVLSAEGLEKSSLTEQAMLYRALGQGVTKSELDRIRAKDDITGRVYAQLSRLAEDFSRLHPELDRHQAMLVVANLQVQNLTIAADGAVTEERGNISLAQMLLKQSVTTDQRANAKILDASPELQAKHARLLRMARPQSKDYATGAEEAFVEVMGAQQFFTLLGDEAGVFGPHLTVEQFLRQYVSLSELDRRQLANALRNDAAYLGRKQSKNMPYSLDEVGDVSAFRAMVDAVLASGNGRISMDHATGKLAGEYADRSDTVAENFRVAHGQVRRALQEYAGLTGREDGELTTDLVRRLLEGNPDFARSVMNLVPNAAANAAFRVKGDQVYAANWLYTMFTIADAKHAEMHYWRNLVLTQWRAKGLNTSEEGEEGEHGRAYSRLDRRIHRIMYKLAKHPDGGLVYQQFVNQLESATDVEEFLRWVNTTPGIRGEQAPLVAWVDDTAEFDADKAQGGWTTSLAGAELRESIATLRQRSEALVSELALEKTTMANDLRARSAIRRVLKKDAGDTSVVLDAGDRELHDRFVKAIDLAGDWHISLGPQAMLFEVVGAVQGFNASSHTKGQSATNVENAGQLDASRDAYDYVTNYERLMASLTSVNLDAVGANLPQVAKDGGRSMDDHGRPVEWGKPTPAQMLDLLENPDSRPGARAMLFPQVMERNLAGTLTPQLLVGKSLADLLRGTSHKDMFPRNGVLGQEAAAKYISMVEGVARKYGGHFAVQRAVTDLVIARTSYADHVLSTAEIESMASKAMYEVAQVLQAVGALASMPTDPGTDTLADIMAEVRTQQRLHRTARALGLEVTDGQDAIDVVIDTFIAEREKEAADDLRGLGVQAATDPANEARYTAQMTAIQDDLDRFTARVELLRADDLAGQVVEMFSVTGDAAEQAAGKTKVAEYILDHLSMLQRSSASLVTLTKFTQQMLDPARNGQPSLSDKEWAELSRTVIGAYLDDVAHTSPGVGSVSPWPDADRVQDQRYFDNSWSYLVEDLLRSNAPLAQAARDVHRIAGRQGEEPPTRAKFYDLLGRTVLDGDRLGPWSGDIPRASIAANLRLDSAAAGAAIAIPGNAPKRQAALMASTRRTTQLPGAQLHATVLLTWRDLMREPFDEVVVATATAGGVNRPLAQLNNRFARQVVMSYTDAAGQRQSVDLMPQVGRPWHGNDEVRDSGYQEVHLDRIRRAVDKAAGKVGVDPTDVTVTMEFFHPDDQPAEDYHNNVYFEGTSFKLDADRHESLISTLWFTQGSISPEMQAAALDSAKLGKAALQVIEAATAAERIQVEATWSTDFAAMLRAKTRRLLETDLGFGKLDPEFYNAVYKDMKIRHFVRGVTPEGTPVLWTAEQVIAHQLATPGTPLPFDNAELWVPSDDVLRSLHGEQGTQGVARIFDDQLEIDPSRIPRYQGVTDTMLQRFAEGITGNKVALPETRVFNRGRQTTLTVRTQLDAKERSAFDAKMRYFEERRLDIHMDRGEAQSQSKFDAKANLSRMVEAGKSMLSAENLSVHWASMGIPFGPRRPEDTAISQSLLRNLAAATESDGFRTGWIYREGSKAQPMEGLLSEISLGSTMRKAYRVAPGDLVVVELDSFAGDKELARTRVDYLARNGATVLLGATDGQADMRAELSEYLLSDLQYEPIAGSQHAYRPAEYGSRFQNQRARSSGLTETRGVSTKNRIATLSVQGLPVHENAAWINHGNERLGGIGVVANLVPTGALAGFNVPVESFSNASQIDAVRQQVRGFDTAEGRAFLKDQANGFESDEAKRAKLDADFDRSFDALLDRFDTNPGTVLPQPGDTFGTGDIIPLVDSTGRVLLYRHGFKALRRDQVDDLAALTLPSSRDAAGIAVFPSREEGAASTHTGEVVAFRPRAGFGLEVELNIGLQDFGNKIQLEANGMKYVTTPKPDSLVLPAHGFFPEWGIDLVDSLDDRISKEAVDGMVLSHRDAFAYLGIDFLPDATEFFFPGQRDSADFQAKTRELLGAIATRVPRIPVLAADELINATQLGTSFTEMIPAAATSSVEGLDPNWVARLGDLSTTEARITSAMIVYLMTPGARVADVLSSGGFNADGSTNPDMQSRLMPRLFTQVFDNARPGSALRVEINDRLNDQLHNPNHDGTGYRLNEDFMLEVLNADGRKNLVGRLSFAEAHAAGDNPVKNGMSFSEDARGAVSQHSAAIVYGATGAETAYKYDIAKARAFAEGKDIEHFERDVLDGGAWRMLTDIPAKDKTFREWRPSTPAEAERLDLNREAMVQFRQPIVKDADHNWSEKQVNDYANLAQSVVRELGLLDAQSGLVDFWVRQILGQPHGEDKDHNDMGRVTGKGAIEAAKDILWAVEHRYLPTVAGEVPAIHLQDLQTIYRANKNRPHAWAPRESMDTATTTVTSWDDWTKVALGTALTSDNLFDPLYLLALDGFVNTYQNATRSLMDLPVSVDILVNQKLADPELNRMLVSVNDQVNTQVTEPLVLDTARATLADVIGGQRIAGKFQGKAAPASEVAKRRNARRKWRAEHGVPLPLDVSLKNFRKNGADFVDEGTTTNALIRSLIQLRLGMALINPALYVSMGPEQWIRGGLDRAANILTGQATVGATGKLMAKVGASRYTPEQLTRLNELYRVLGQRNDFRGMIYKEMRFEQPHAPGRSRFERGLEGFGRVGTMMQDPTYGMRAPTTARRYLEAALQHIAATPTRTVISTDMLIANMMTNPLWLKEHHPEVHQAASNAVAQIRSMRHTVLGQSLRGIYEPMASSANPVTNMFGNLVLKIPMLFSNYAMNVATTVLGLQGLDQMTAMFLHGRQKGLPIPGFENTLIGRVQAKMRGEEFSPDRDAQFDMSTVIEGIDLSRAFIRGGLTHAGLFAFGLAAGGLGLSGEDDEMKKRRLMAAHQGVGNLYDPRRIENDFRKADSIYLDHLPFGIGSMFSDSDEHRSPVQLHWMVKQFLSPVIGMEKFFETGDTRHITWGFEDALGAFPLVNTMMWHDVVETGNAMIHDAAPLAESSDPKDNIQSASILTKVVSTYERMLFENSFVNQLYIGYDGVDRDPYVLPLRDSDGTLQRDIEGNARPQNLALQTFMDPITHKPRTGYLGRSDASAEMHVMSENRMSFALVSSLFTGGIDDSDYWRYNMPIKMREIEKAPVSLENAKAYVLGAAAGGLKGSHQLNVTVDEILPQVRNELYKIGERTGHFYTDDEIHAAAERYVHTKGSLRMSMVDDVGDEVLTMDGAKGIMRGLFKGSVKFGDPALQGIFITTPQRKQIQADWAKELVQEGIDLGLDQTKAVARMKRVLYGPLDNPAVQGLADILWAPEEQLSYNKTQRYVQLNTTYVIGPDGMPWATGFERSKLLSAMGLPPFQSMIKPEHGGVTEDSRGNTVDLVNGLNTGLRALEPIDDSRNVPTDVEIGKSIEKAIEDAAKADYAPLTPFDSKSSGRGGYYNNYGGYGGYGGGGGSSSGAYFTKMYSMPFNVSPYGNSAPFINTSNPIIRRADVRRERVWSERGRLKQWQ